MGAGPRGDPRDAARDAAQDRRACGRRSVARRCDVPDRPRGRRRRSAGGLPLRPAHRTGYGGVLDRRLARAHRLRPGASMPTRPVAAPSAPEDPPAGVFRGPSRSCGSPRAATDAGSCSPRIRTRTSAGNLSSSTTGWWRAGSTATRPPHAVQAEHRATPRAARPTAPAMAPRARRRHRHRRLPARDRPGRPRPGVRIVQLWHASGRSRRSATAGSASRRSGSVVAHAQELHPRDRELRGRRAVLREAFGIPEARVIPTGIPRMDRFFDEASRVAGRRAAFGAFPTIGDRRTILSRPRSVARAPRDAATTRRGSTTGPVRTRHGRTPS